MRKKDPRSHIKGVKTCKKHVKLVKLHDFSSLGVHIQDFAQTQQNVAQSHDCMTATFRKSASGAHMGPLRGCGEGDQ